MTNGLLASVGKRNVSLMVLVNDGVTQKLDKSKVKVIAEAPPNAQGVLEVKLKAILPSGFELIEIRPDIVSVTIK